MKGGFWLTDPLQLKKTINSINYISINFYQDRLFVS
jgi:hypothetical protein